MSNLYEFLYKHFRKTVLRLYKIEIMGTENEPSEDGFMICSNHLSNRDVVVLAASLKTRINYLAKAELFRIPLLSSLVRALGAYPVNRGHADVAAIKRTIALLREGKSVGIFPQGTRHAGKNPKDTPIKHGVGMIEYRTRVPILPVCIETEDFRVRPFRKTCVRIGKPIYPDEFSFDKGTPDEFGTASELVFSRITSMLEK